MKGLSRRERHELAALGKQLPDEDPELAELLKGPPPPPHAARAARMGSVWLTAGVVMLLYGILLSTPVICAFGGLLLMSWWVPSRLSGSGTA